MVIELYLKYLLQLYLGEILLSFSLLRQQTLGRGSGRNSVCWTLSVGIVGASHVTALCLQADKTTEPLATLRARCVARPASYRFLAPRQAHKYFVSKPRLRIPFNAHCTLNFLYETKVTDSI